MDDSNEIDKTLINNKHHGDTCNLNINEGLTEWKDTARIDISLDQEELVNSALKIYLERNDPTIITEFVKRSHELTKVVRQLVLD